MRRLFAHPLLAIVVVVSCSLGCTTSTAIHRAAQRLPLEPCEIEGPDESKLRVLCGTHEVWEDREARVGRKIPLHIVVVPALAKVPEPDPLFPFAGGPGDAATGGAAFYASLPAEMRTRDVVLVDQRGTGKSNRLQCEVPGGPDYIQGYFEPTFNTEVARKCREQLEERANLALYTTSIAMDDINEVREWLGYGLINLEGGSYGTRAAQVYMRRHPETVRTATLLGTVGMQQTMPLHHARDGKRATLKIIARCAADEVCNAAFPNLAEEHVQLMARLNQEPGKVSFPHPETGEPVPVEISREVFAERIRHGLYTVPLSRAIPLLIHQAYEGDYLPIARLGYGFESVLRDFLALGMYLSVTCAEDVPYIEESQIKPLNDGTFLGDSRIRSQQAACAEWPRGEIPEGFHEDVKAKIPTLLVTGDYDPVTPPMWAEITARGLPRSLQVVVPEGHHGFFGLSHLECVQKLQADFLDQASTENLDTTCIGTMQRPPFLTQPEELKELLENW